MSGPADQSGETPPEPIGSYRLVRPLGSGGMSSVYLARHEQSGCEVALKVLPRALAKKTTFLERFIREAQSAESLDHPNIVSIFDHGCDDGRYYLVLELVEGSDLQEWVRSKGPLDPAMVVSVLREAAAGLAYAAKRGLVHRDIKPANILRRPDGHVKLIDLGLAMQVDSEDEPVTRAGTTVGTVDYMAPEQARDSRAATLRSDIYSLGCTAFFLLTGRPPYDGTSVAEKLTRHVRDPVPDPRLFAPDTPERLARLVRMMMSKKAEERPADHEAILAALADPGLLTEPIATVEFDDDPDGFVLGDPGSGPSPSEILAGASTIISPIAPLLAGEPMPAPLPSMAELALLASDSTDRIPAKAPTRAAAPLPAGPSSSSAERSASGFRLVDSSPEIEAEPAPLPAASPSLDRDRLLVGAAAGFLALLLLVGLWLGTRNRTGVTPGVAESPEVAAEADLRGLPRERQPEAVVEAAPPSANPVTPAEEGSGSQLVSRAAPAPLLEPEFDPHIEADMDPGLAEPDRGLTGAPLVVGRLGDASLRKGLQESDMPIVRVADTGPFFEYSPRVVGRMRRVEAGPGVRPLIVLSRPAGSGPVGGSSVLELANQSVVLQGLDLVIRVAEQDESIDSIFGLTGATLVLRDCTITVASGGSRSFGLAKTKADSRGRRSGILLESTHVRGLTGSVLDSGGAGVDLSLLRSVVASEGTRPFALIGEGGTAADPQGAAPQSVSIRRSLVVATGPLLEVVREADRPAPAQRPKVRVLGSVLVQTDGLTPLMNLPDGELDRPEALVDWRGEANRYQGWGRAWAGTKRGDVRLADLEAARQAWPSTDASSVSIPAQPTGLPDVELAEAMSYQAWAPDLAATLLKVAVPSAGLVPRALAGYLPTKVGDGNARLAPTPIVVDLSTARGADDGDLGRLVSEALRGTGSAAVWLQVRGRGTWPIRRMELPRGAQVEIEVLPDASGELARFTPVGQGESLIEATGATLRVRGLVVEQGAAGRFATLLRATGGETRLRGCRFTTLTSGSAMTLESPQGAGSVLVAEECQFLSAGPAIVARQGDGVLRLSGCVVEGAVGLDLKPLGGGAGYRPELQLDRTSILGGDALVRFGEWPEGAPNPEKPWVVFSQRCLFLGHLRDRRTRPPVLQIDRATLGRGAVGWQASSDLYDVGAFAAEEPLDLAGSDRSDLVNDWVGFWGRPHVVNCMGPKARIRQPMFLELDAPPIDPALLCMKPGPDGEPQYGARADRWNLVPRLTPFRRRAAVDRPR